MAKLPSLPTKATVKSELLNIGIESALSGVFGSMYSGGGGGGGHVSANNTTREDKSKKEERPIVLGSIEAFKQVMDDEYLKMHKQIEESARLESTLPHHQLVRVNHTAPLKTIMLTLDTNITIVDKKTRALDIKFNTTKALLDYNSSLINKANLILADIRQFATLEKYKAMENSMEAKADRNSADIDARINDAMNAYTLTYLSKIEARLHALESNQSSITSDVVDFGKKYATLAAVETFLEKYLTKGTKLAGGALAGGLITGGLEYYETGNASRAVYKGAGGAAGTLPGIAIGATIGGLPGAVVGGLVGAVGGYFGSEAGETIYDQEVDIKISHLDHRLNKLLEEVKRGNNQRFEFLDIMDQAKKLESKVTDEGTKSSLDAVVKKLMKINDDYNIDGDVHKLNNPATASQTKPTPTQQQKTDQFTTNKSGLLAYKQSEELQALAKNNDYFAGFGDMGAYVIKAASIEFKADRITGLDNTIVEAVKSTMGDLGRGGSSYYGSLPGTSGEYDRSSGPAVATPIGNDATANKAEPYSSGPSVGTFTNNVSSPASSGKFVPGSPSFNAGDLISGATLPKGASADTISALNETAASIGVDPAALSMMINLESNWSTVNKTGSYNGLTQIGKTTFDEAGGRLGGLTYEEFLNGTPRQQMQAYAGYLKHYGILDKAKKLGIDLKKMSPSEQAAFLQSAQFSPGNTSWMRALANGQRDVPTTRTKQANVLGSTSFNDMESYYSRTLGKNSPSYSTKPSNVTTLDTKATTVPGFGRVDDLGLPKDLFSPEVTPRSRATANDAQPIGPYSGSMLDSNSDRLFHKSGNLSGINPKLVNVLRSSTRDLPQGFRAEIISGHDARSTGTTNHPSGLAMDIKIYDDKGNAIPHDKNSAGWKYYESLYRSTVIRGKQMYPDDKFIWGGAWISSAAGRGDPMHYQIFKEGVGSQSSGRYSFDRGLDPDHPFTREGGQLTPEERSSYDARVRSNMSGEIESKVNTVASKPVETPKIDPSLLAPTAPTMPTSGGGAASNSPSNNSGGYAVPVAISRGVMNGAIRQINELMNKAYDLYQTEPSKRHTIKTSKNDDVIDAADRTITNTHMVA